MPGIETVFLFFEQVPFTHLAQIHFFHPHMLHFKCVSSESLMFSTVYDFLFSNMSSCIDPQVYQNIHKINMDNLHLTSI